MMLPLRKTVAVLERKNIISKCYYPRFYRYVGTSSKGDGDAAATEIPPVEEKSEVPKKKPQRPPFVRNLFLGNFDKEILTYPEVLGKERHDLLHEMISPIEKFFKTEVDSSKIDREAKIPAETLQALKDLGLYGLQIPEEYGGLGLNATEYARIAEITALDGSIAVTLAAHQAIGLKGILINGTDAQKQKYLPHLATGEWTAAFCLTEPGSGSDAASIQTTATPSLDGKSFILNGNKIWISNGGTADVFTVFARVEHPVKEIGNVTAFIVERSFGGITSGKPEDKMGIRGSNTTEVHFENTAVPVENVLGDLGGGFKVALNILNSGRFSMGSSCAGVLKDLMKTTIEHAVTRRQFGHPLSSFALIKEKLGRMALDIYAMESMSYLTAGLIDTYEDQDCSVEAAIVKVFSSEKAWEHCSECLQILGGLGFMRDLHYERVLRDCRISLIFEGTNEILRLLISLMGLQQAGIQLAEDVRKIRNPFMNPKLVFSKMLNRVRTVENPKLDLKLHEFLHHSLQESADSLEHCVKRLAYASEDLLYQHGKNVADPQYQINLRRMADIAIDLYAMTAVLGRASRSYCIGIHNSHHEVQLASYFVYEARQRITDNLNNVCINYYIGKDVQMNAIAEALYEKKGYAAEHPLTRVFW